MRPSTASKQGYSKDKKKTVLEQWNLLVDTLYPAEINTDQIFGQEFKKLDGATTFMEEDQKAEMQEL